MMKRHFHSLICSLHRLTGGICWNLLIGAVAATLLVFVFVTGMLTVQYTSENSGYSQGAPFFHFESSEQDGDSLTAVLTLMGSRYELSLVPLNQLLERGRRWYLLLPPELRLVRQLEQLGNDLWEGWRTQQREQEFLGYCDDPTQYQKPKDTFSESTRQD